MPIGPIPLHLLFFPWDVLAWTDFPEPNGRLLASIRGISMWPPYPWGQWQYQRAFEQQCSGLDGDLIELGVGLGGMSVFLGVQARAANKRIFALDTFRGLPAPNPAEDNPYFLKADYSSKTRQDGFRRFRRTIVGHGLSETIVPLQGLFERSFRKLPKRAKFCFAHIDADLHSSVLSAFEGIYDRMVDGGIIAIDDFFHPAQGPARAAAEFFNKRRIMPRYHVVFPYGVFIIKGDTCEKDTEEHRSFDGNVYSLKFLRQDVLLREAVRKSRRQALKYARRGGAGDAVINARRFLKLLEEPRSGNSDIYEYWRCLEDFWAKIGADVRRREVIRI